MRPGRANRKILVLLGLLTAIGSLSTDMYLPALPEMAADLGASPSQTQVSLMLFFIGLSLGQLFYGPLADRFGRRIPLYAGLILYQAASVGCALSDSIQPLLAFRLLQAAGACAGIVIARAVVRDLFGKADSARAYSFLLLVMGAAPILAPLLGGYLNKFLGWRSIFCALALMGLMALLACILSLPETAKPDTRVRFRNAFRVYFRILKDRQFASYTFTGGLARAGLFAYITGSPFVFIGLFGVPPERFGWIFGLNALGLIGCAQLNNRLLKRADPDRILKYGVRGAALAGTGLLSAALLRPGFWTIAVPLFAYLCALGFTSPNSAAEAMAGHGERAGSASALFGMIQLMLATAVSALVSLFNDGGAVPMAAVVAACGLSSLAVCRLFIRKPESRPDRRLLEEPSAQLT